MEQFAALIDALVYTRSRNEKLRLIGEYLRATPDPDRGWALAALSDGLDFPAVKSSTIRTLLKERVDPVLWTLSRDFVGDTAETASLLWPQPDDAPSPPSVSETVELLKGMTRKSVLTELPALLDRLDVSGRYALLKLATGAMRIGISARLAKVAFADAFDVPVEEVEEYWHGLAPPYPELFAWAAEGADPPDMAGIPLFKPFMLAHPLEDTVVSLDDYVAEWKWDGIRVQLVIDGDRARLFSRTGDDISAAFPDLVEALGGRAVLDGELLVGHDFDPMNFNHLQQRLNRKTPAKSHIRDYPAFVRVYDMLFDGEEDIRDLPLVNRRRRLEAWMATHAGTRLDLSEILAFNDWDELAALRRMGGETHGHEGLMIKQLKSLYVAGRPKGPWFKWKRDPRLIDTVMMYAQRGHGRRSSFYSDYTFGIWRGNEIVPVGKAYSGFTDGELRDLDKWVRGNTVNRFGPVREVEKDLVVELAFDSAHESPRHKSGIALRFPRVSRIRWDKPASEADTIETVRKLIG